MRKYIQIDEDTNVIIGRISTTNEIDDNPSYIAVDVLPELDTTKIYTYIDGEITLVGDNTEALYVQNKAIKVQQVSELLVTTSTGKVFDGDETSQDRMTRAILISGYTGQDSTQWKLADNTITIVTVAELQEALALAGSAMSGIWTAN